MEPVYDVFLSYSRDDAHIASLLGTALTRAGLRVFVDTADIAPFQSITSRISGALKICKAMLIVYSTSYPVRRACQWELTQAFIMTIDDPQQRDRIMVVNCADTFDHIQPVELRDALSMPDRAMPTRPIGVRRPFHERLQSSLGVSATGGRGVSRNGFVDDEKDRVVSSVGCLSYGKSTALLIRVRLPRTPALSASVLSRSPAWGESGSHCSRKSMPCVWAPPIREASFG